MSDAAGAIAAFRRFQRPAEETRALERIAKDPMQTRALDQFRRALDRAPDIKTALRDPRVLQVVTVAMGIPDGAQQAGLAMRALTSDPTDAESLVNRLPDKRWKAAAEALRLDQRGLDALRDPEVQERLTDGLRRARWRDELEESQPGLGDALLFRERAAKGAEGAFAVLGDPVLRRVVTGAVGLPKSIAVQSVETQARALEARLKLDSLNDPRVVQRLAERYLVNRASEAGGAFGAPSAGTSNALALLGLPPGGLRV
ncbi:MAG TPA: DUF1217 domain-containing protein [Roseococcus sp.]|jgi:hypothetical protein|nr:DUF1217 domain-containing protein [Roseococcus sp.]